jgi:hypothetical protein
MSEVDDLLEQVRNEESSRRPRGRTVILSIAGLATVAALTGGAILAVSASASIASFDAQNAAAASEVRSQPGDTTGDGAVDAASDIEAAPAEAPTSDAAANAAPDAATVPAAGEPAAAASDVPPVYDADTDFATIPAPPAEWPESELLNADVWLAQQEIVGDCMQEQGFDYSFTPFWLNVPMPDEQETDEPINLNGAPGSAQWVALWGADDQPLGEDYDWQQAGCHGYAVHVTGMDDAN